MNLLHLLVATSLRKLGPLFLVLQPLLLGKMGLVLFPLIWFPCFCLWYVQCTYSSVPSLRIREEVILSDSSSWMWSPSRALCQSSLCKFLKDDFSSWIIRWLLGEILKKKQKHIFLLPADTPALQGKWLGKREQGWAFVPICPHSLIGAPWTLYVEALCLRQHTNFEIKRCVIIKNFKHHKRIVLWNPITVTNILPCFLSSFPPTLCFVCAVGF